jgi:protein SCO1/2
LTTTWASRVGLRAILQAALLGILLAACSPDAPKFRSTDITGADFGKELALQGHDGKPRTLADFRGKAVVLFFGFTHCPDICPTTLADVAGALKKLGRDASHVQVLFVTLDPERDTPGILAKYVTAFHPDFLGLYGDAAATQRTAKEFKIFYEKRAGGAPGAYTIDHSGQSYVLDPQGRLRLVIRHDRIAQDLADDLKSLLGDTSR